MAFSGYLIKSASSNTYFPERLIVAGSYEVVPDRRQDKDPTRDLNGILHRAVVSAKPSTIKFDTRELHAADVAEIHTFLSACLVNGPERKVRITFWNPDSDSYKTEYMYLPDLTYTIVCHTNSDIVYAPMTLEFIGYGD